MALACTVALSPAATAQVTTDNARDGDIVVTGDREGYTPTDTSAAKIPAPLRDIPQSIAVVPAQVLLDQRVDRRGKRALTQF